LQTTFLHEDRIVAHSTSASAALSERFGTLFRYWLCATALIAGTLFSFASFAQTYGTLDTSWNGIGYVKTPILSPTSNSSGDYGRAIAVQLDGKVVVAGVCNNATPPATTFSVCVARYNANGSLDATLNTTGTVTASLPGGDINHVNAAVALAPFGEIIVAATCRDTNNRYQFCVYRFTKSGMLDTAFGSNGVLMTTLATASNFSSSIAFQNDGRFIIGGICGTQICAVRYPFDGNAIDTSFGNNGVLLNSATGSFNRETFTMLIDTSDRISLAGSCFVSSRPVFCLSRFTSNGLPDSSFGTNGVASTPDVPGDPDYAFAMTIQTDGKILLAGQAFNTVNGRSVFDFATVRYNANGTLDTAFGGIGSVVTRIADTVSVVRAVVEQADGKIVVAGHCRDFSPSGDRFCLVAYNADGTLDTSFNGSGVSKLLLGPQNSFAVDQSYALAIGRDGKLYAVGECRRTTATGATSQYDFCVARYHGSPTGGLACVADLSGDGNFRATQDSLALARVARGAWNENPFAVLAAFENVISSPQQISIPFKRWLRGSFDYDGDGLETITDALIHARVALGYTDTGVTNGLPFSSNATRTTWTALRNHFVNRCGLTLP
jgi:uncharacterized delta-60 repeat protein